MKEQYVMEEIKTMFKASRKLYQAFSDIKRLTRKYLLKVTKIKGKKKLAIAEMEEKKKRQEIQAKKRQKMKQRKQKQNKQRQEQEKKNQDEGRNRMVDQKEEKKPEQKSIFSIIKSKQKESQYKPTSSKPSLKNIKSARQKAEKEETKKKSTKQKEKGKSKSKGAEEEEPKASGKILQKPQPPQSPYFRFLRMKKNQIKSSTENIPMDKVSKIMKNVWDKMNDEQRSPYVKPYENECRLYERQMAQYYKSNKNPESSSKKQVEARKQDSQKNNFDFIDQLDKM